MKVHELIADLQALSSMGLRNAEVEVVFLTAKGHPFRRVVTTAQRCNELTAPNVVELRAVLHRELHEVEG